MQGPDPRQDTTNGSGRDDEKEPIDSDPLFDDVEGLAESLRKEERNREPKDQQPESSANKSHTKDHKHS